MEAAARRAGAESYQKSDPVSLAARMDAAPLPPPASRALPSPGTPLAALPPSSLFFLSSVISLLAFAL